METINKQYIVDEQNKKVAVQIPIEAFKRLYPNLASSWVALTVEDWVI